MRQAQRQGDKTYSFRGAPSEVLRQQELRRRGPASTQERVVPPSQQAVREAIAAQTCPFCGRGPYKVLAVHTNKIHGVDKYELRDLAGLSTQDAISSPEFIQDCRDRALADTSRWVNARVTKGSTRRTKRARWTAAGLQKQRSTLEKLNAERGDEYWKMQRSKAGRAAAKKRYAHLPPRPPCAGCGNQMPASRPRSAKTCGPECHKVVRRQRADQQILNRRCSVDGCERPHDARGYCPTHYQRWKKDGDPGPAQIEARGKYESVCEINGCTERHVARGLCRTHYNRRQAGRTVEAEED